MAESDRINFGEFIRIVVSDIFQEELVLIDSILLLLNTDFLGLQNGQLLALAVDFSVTILIVFLQLGDVLVALTHDFGIVVKECSVLDQTLLQLVIFLTKLSLSTLEFKFLLREMLLLSDIGLLVLVHFAALIKEAGCW